MSETKTAMETLVLPLFVASAIVEHAKRRTNSAGYLVGNLSGNQISVTDYIPCTHESTTDLNTRAYEEELNERIAIKKYYSSNITLIGWYAAGSPEPGNQAAFDAWCQAPGTSFLRGRTENQAVMLIGFMPTAKDMTVRWAAYLTVNSIKDHVTQCKLTQQLAVSVEAETQSMNVLLAEIISKSLYNGGKPYPTSQITNLDYVALEAARGKEADGGRKDNKQKEGEVRPLETALLNVQKKLDQAISHARSVVANGNNSKGDKQGESEAILKNYEVILEEKNQQSSRNDFVNEAYKDALMIKYTTALLRRHLMDIERHSRYEVREKGQNQNPHHRGVSSTGQRKNVAFR